jgi:hypothetical protein
LSFVGINPAGTIATYIGSSNIQLAGGPSAVETRILVSMVSGATLIDAATLGLASGAALEVTGDFTVNVLYEAGPMGSLQPAVDYFDAQSTGSCAGGCTRIDYNSGFYDVTAANAPEPTSLALMSLGLVGAGFLRRRRGL